MNECPLCKERFEALDDLTAHVSAAHYGGLKVQHTDPAGTAANPPWSTTPTAAPTASPVAPFTNPAPVAPVAPPVPIAPAKRKKAAKPPSRPQRWAEAVGKVKDALSAISTALSELEGATADLGEIKQEFVEWNGNLSENLRGSAVGEKLQAIEDLDIESIHSDLQSAFDEAEGKADEAENAELPLGFGRD